MSLSDEVINKLIEKHRDTYRVAGRSSIYRINDYKVNIRAATEKSGDKYFFDVALNFLESYEISFFVYACGYQKNVYVFPAAVLKEMLASASFDKKRNKKLFTIFLDRHQLEPAGQSDSRLKIEKYYNNYGLLDK